jgi:hypothetical protein
MMPAKYIDLEGNKVEYDLDSVIDVVNGWSRLKDGWQGYIIYLPDSHRFVELMSSIPDFRGDSASISVEVTSEYVKKTYGLTTDQLSRIQSDPISWNFIQKR